MRSMKRLSALVAVFAIAAIGAGNAVAAEFTASATGVLFSSSTEFQKWTTNGGAVSCFAANGVGSIPKTADTEQKVTVEYGGCSAFGFATADVTSATYRFTSSGEVHLGSTITITPTWVGTPLCTVTIKPQTFNKVDYANAGTSNIKVTPTVTGIVYESSGGVCGSSGKNGTFGGASEWVRGGGGILRFDP